MHYGKLHYVYALNVEENTAIMLWWSPGCHFYQYQTIDNVINTAIDSVNRVYSPLNLDPMSGNDLSIVLQECWAGYEIMEYSTDYTG